MIYVTRFDPEHPNRACIGVSDPAPFPSLDAAEAMLGAPLRKSPRLLLYAGVAVSDFPFAIDAKDNSGPLSATTRLY